MEEYILCIDCKNYSICKSIHKDSANSINCEEQYGLYESKESED